MTDRPAPYDPDAEQSVIGAALYNYDAITAADLQPEDFYVPRHAHTWHAIQTLYNHGDHIDHLTVAGQLDRAGHTWDGHRADLLTWTTHTPSSSGAASYAHIVARHATQRRIIAAAADATTAAQTGDIDQAVNHLNRAQQGAAHQLSDSRQFTPTPLADLLTNPPEPPPMVTDWVYAAQLTTIQAEPEVGKSWLALWQALQAIRTGHDIVYLDEEGGDRLVAERLRALGATTDDVAHLHYFPFERRRWDGADLAALDRYLTRLHETGATPGFGVFDSLADFLAAAGIDENSNSEVTGFVGSVCEAFRARGWAQLVLDHVTKPPTQGPRKASRYSRGAGSKLAKAGATILVEVAEHYDRTNSGVLKVCKTKDRDASIRLPRQGQGVKLLAMTVKDGTLTITPHSTNEHPDDIYQPRQEFQPGRAMEAVSRLLEEAAMEMSKTAIENLTEGFKAKTIRTALERLVHQGYVKRRPGARNAQMHTSARPYRDPDNPTDPSQPDPNQPELLPEDERF